MKKVEIDKGETYTGFQEALALVKANTGPAGTDVLPLAGCAGYVSAGDVFARISSPAGRTSLKDGFAVQSADTAGADRAHPRKLTPAGAVFAGGAAAGGIKPGQAVRVCTGAMVPDGADAVIAAELCREEANGILIFAENAPGQNILPAGDDVAAHDRVISKGQVISPALLAYAAAGGIDRLTVYRKPRFGLISIGDELVEPGRPLRDGQMYASNLIYNAGWLTYLGIPYEAVLAADDAESIAGRVSKMVPQVDAIITSGGVMNSERDLTVDVLNSLGWQIKFRHVRSGPGKATAFGVLQGKPVFCFSGAPASNALAFLEFALAGIHRMLGLPGDPLEAGTAVLKQDIEFRNPDWTEFREARLETDGSGGTFVVPFSGKGRLKSGAAADCLICKPEGVDTMKAGQTVTVHLLPAFLRTRVSLKEEQSHG